VVVKTKRAKYKREVVTGDSKEGKVDLVGLVPAKELRPVRKTFSLSFIPLNI